MKDIMLDFVNKKMLNKTIDNQYRVAQQIRVALRSWRGDFFINANFGVDYDNCWHDQLLMKAYIAQSIKDIDGVLSINAINISREKDNNNKTYFLVNAEVVLESGVINISETVNGVY